MRPDYKQLFDWRWLISLVIFFENPQVQLIPFSELLNEA